MDFPDFFNKDQGPYTKVIREGQPFKEIVRDHNQLYCAWLPYLMSDRKNSQ